MYINPKEIGRISPQMLNARHEAAMQMALRAAFQYAGIVKKPEIEQP